MPSASSLFSGVRASCCGILGQIQNVEHDYCPGTREVCVFVVAPEGDVHNKEEDWLNTSEHQCVVSDIEVCQCS